MDKSREAFEAKCRELHPNDKCTLMANGNYSGWIKQVYWEAWQSRQAEVDEKDRRIEKALDCIGRFWKEGCLFPECLSWAEKALRGGDHV